ncbi:MAG: globin domain-containing protein [Actinomycetes bacterium]
MDPRLLKESYALIEPVANKVAGDFYARLFLESPPVRDMFPVAMDAQRDRLMNAILRIVQSLDDPDSLLPMLRQLGRDHRKFGVGPAHYEAVGRNLILSIRKYVGSAWTPQMERAWWEAYRFAARTMIEAAERSAQTTPPWWRARVVSHERRTFDVAVLTVQTEQPLQYQPGQYVAVETPWVPRTWRVYSMANIARGDGLLEFHVKAVGIGGVSSALVRRVQMGDELRIAAPTGQMVLDSTSGSRDMLFVAGSTGLAPMKALVEDLAQREVGRTAHLFFGVRRRDDLYDLSDLLRMAARYPWLRVVPAVSDDPSYAGERGNLSDVLSRYGPWTYHDVFVAGGPAMTRATLYRLYDLGVPASRIRYDSFGPI